MKHPVLKRAAAILAGVLILVVSFPALAETLTGQIRMETPEGRVLRGTDLRVLLATEPVFAPPSLSDLPTEPNQRYEQLNRLHLDYFEKVTRRQNDPGFRVGATVSDEKGRFIFSGVAPGRYFVIITFPAALDGYKVAWQVPVVLLRGSRPACLLDGKNLLLPAVKR